MADEGASSSTLSASRVARRATTGARAQLFWLLQCDRPVAGSERFLLEGIDLVTLGRGREPEARVERGGTICRLAVALPDSRLSREHARLLGANGHWILEDANSKNGTLVNGVKVRRRLLVDGDLIEVGHSLLLFRDAVVPATDSGPVVPHLQTFVADYADALATLARVASSTVSVVILGDTGTGKEVIARVIHDLSQRRGPFVAVNCGAVPHTLIEATLFGHRKGAFSGAVDDRPGLVRSADGGTLLLDEIGDLPHESQAALLRFLQEGEVMPVGDSRPTKVNVRLLSATHHDLGALTDGGRFRRDLYARVSGFTLRLPLLRERREDLGLLIASILRRLGSTAERATFTAEAARALVAHDWPLNVRELERCLAVAVVVAGGARIELQHLPETVRGVPAAAQRSPEDQRRARWLEELLGKHGGNISKVAEEAGKGRTQIHRWLKQYGLDAAAFRRT